MSITRQLLDLMGSSLVVKSEYGRGSVFSFAVIQDVMNWEEIGEFAERFDDEKMDACEYHALFFAPEARILVVDDEEIAAEHARIVLDEAGIKADTSNDGPTALHMLEVQHAKHNPYNLVLLDWKMPEK